MTQSEQRKSETPPACAAQKASVATTAGLGYFLPGTSHVTGTAG